MCAGKVRLLSLKKKNPLNITSMQNPLNITSMQSPEYYQYETIIKLQLLKGIGHGMTGCRKKTDICAY